MRRTPLLRTIVAIAVIAVSLAAGAHAFALSRYRASFPPSPLPARAAAIREALVVEPWNEGFKARQAYVHAEELVAKGDLDGAYTVLHDAVYRWDDPAVAALYRKVYPLWYQESSRKAHVQHGKEGPGGTLRPEDVQR